MSKDRALLLATDGRHTRMLYQLLKKHFPEVVVILEKKEPLSKVFSRRVRKQGLFSAVGQVFFKLLIVPFLKKPSRISEIMNEYGYLEGDFDPDFRVDNINEAGIDWKSEKFETDCIFINGTRVIGKRVLEQLSATPINIHVGITPKYRGVHGGYWALYLDEPEHFGTTLHLVDSGIDTGGIIEQSVLKPAKSDNFSTYPTLQYCEGLRLLENNMEAIKSGNAKTIPSLMQESRLHFHPRFFQYLFGRMSGGVK